MNAQQKIAASASLKMANGSLMTLAEVAARLSVSPVTVHRMPLASIRLGRSLRFDPRDVAELITGSREIASPSPVVVTRSASPTTGGVGA